MTHSPLFVLPLHSTEETPLSERETQVGGPVSSVSGERYRHKTTRVQAFESAGWQPTDTDKGSAATVVLPRPRASSWELTARLLFGVVLFQTALFVFLAVAL